MLQVGELAVHQAVHGNEHPAAFLQRLGINGDSRLVGGGAEDIECDGEAEGLVDQRLDGGNFNLPPGMVSLHICDRWTQRASHLSRFHGISVAGGNFNLPHGMVSRHFCARWKQEFE